MQASHCWRVRRELLGARSVCHRSHPHVHAFQATSAAFDRCTEPAVLEGAAAHLQWTPGRRWHPAPAPAATARGWSGACNRVGSTSVARQQGIQAIVACRILISRWMQATVASAALRSVAGQKMAVHDTRVLSVQNACTTTFHTPAVRRLQYAVTRLTCARTARPPLHLAQSPAATRVTVPPQRPATRIQPALWRMRGRVRSSRGREGQPSARAAARAAAPRAAGAEGGQAG